MDDTRYSQLADETFKRLETLLDGVDPDDVDVERSGHVLTLTFKDGKKAVINTQRPTHQIWLAANARAWHFGWDDTQSKWMDDKGQGVELFERVIAIVKDHAGVDVSEG
jgi:CyaY protein